MGKYSGDTMSWYLRALEKVGERTYRVYLAGTKGEKSFEFHVSLHCGIEIVEIEEAFNEFFGMQTSGSEPILAAVSAFHRANVPLKPAAIATRTVSPISRQ